MRTRDPQKERALRRKALELIVAEGFDGFSMQKLARAAGVSPATIYIYFADRDGLLLALYAEAMARMTEATLEDFDPDQPFAEGLRIQWINRARWCLGHPLEADFLEQVRFSPLHDAAQKAVPPTFTDAMRAFCANAIRRRELVKVPVEVLWSVAYAPLYQLIKFHRHGKGMPGTGPFALDDKTLLRALELVLKALKP
jgi:AcrR family transcriptional regulator